MAKRDYYDILDVDRAAADAEIKQAYRRLAMKFHPDRSPDDADAEARFKETKEAYEVLSDPKKRAAYDHFGHAGVDASAGFGRGAGSHSGDVFGDIFGDVFGDIFGAGRRGRSQMYRGADLRYALDLDLEQAVSGDNVSLTIPTMLECRECGGSGAQKGTHPTSCSTCGGVGQVRMQQGFFSLQQTCPHCGGRGQVIDNPCSICRGNGRIRDSKTLSVKIPTGIDHGDRIRLGGEGEAGRNGGPPGDLYVEVRLRPHAIFQRDGPNLSCEVPVSFACAALGGTVQVPTLGASVALKIPSGSQTGRVFRMRGKGVTTVRGSLHGDLMCRIVVETPVKLSVEHKELLETFDASVRNDSVNHSPREKGWLDGVKRFFERVAG